MGNLLKVKRGLKSNLQNAGVVDGEIKYTKDTKELYIGDGENNIKIGGNPLDMPISTATQNALNLKLNASDLGNAELDIQKNGTSVGKFTANASTDKVINIEVPTQASDVNALPDSTKYGASLSLSINSSTYVVTAQLKDQDGNNLGSAQTIDLPLESVVVNGSYNSTNKKIILTLENGNTIDIPVGDLVAGLQTEITVDNKLASDLVDDTNQTHKFATSAQLTQIATNTSDISSLQSGKADKATTLAGYGITDAYTKTEIDSALGGKQDTIDSSHKLSADLVDDTSTTHKFVTSTEKTTWNSKQDALTTAQLNAVNSGITSAKVTQYDGYATSKANVSLDNLNSTGQMVIDTQNDTISNCILEIPQNIKLELANNVLTLKAGSILTLTGSTYATVTRATDLVRDNIILAANIKFVFWLSKTASSFGWSSISRIGSGSELPVNGATYYYFFLTTDKNYYHWENNNWVVTEYTYPVCIIDSDEQGNLSFAKDSNGNDMIFNGACFVGHHAVVYPNVVSLRPNKKDIKEKLQSYYIKTDAVIIQELNSNYHIATITGRTTTSVRPYIEVDTLDTNDTGHFQYSKQDNVDYFYNGSWVERYETPFINYTYDGTTVTDFTIRQPVRLATTEMLDNYSTTDEVNSALALKQDITTAVNYDNITNCITEIPQDIKLELNNGTLTLKAGSKIYVPNGAGGFDSYITPADKDNNTTISSNTWYLVFYNSSTDRLNCWYGPNIRWGSEAPSSSQDGTLYYDYTNNQYYWKNAGNWVILSNYSLPLGKIISDNNSAISSIDQVYNGFGYIGSTVFILPGVKGLAANGRNSDGTLKSSYVTVNSLLIRTISSTQNTKEMAFTSNGILLNTFSYNEEANYLYDANNTQRANTIVVGSAEFNQSSPYNVTKFEVKTPFHAVDYNDFSELSDKVSANTTDIATKQDIITTITGYDATKTQTLKNVNGALTWVDD